MVTWFEKSKEMIVSQGNSKEETIANMVEDFFDLLMVKITLNNGYFMFIVFILRITLFSLCPESENH